ncbi:MAG: hypothetical protein HY823_03320 [Acidobacteria bacterium]|nr:hypothetical protein [Acidobacteriota bacterium]
MLLSLPRDTLPEGRGLGFVRIPGSKSATNRAFLLAAISPGESLLAGTLEAEDTRWMQEALGSCGVPCERTAEGWHIRGGAAPRPERPIWVGASGTTLRFLLPWLAWASRAPVEIRGEPRLFERPLAPLVQALAPWGVEWRPHGEGGILQPAPNPPLRLEARVEAELSSQFLSGLAMTAAGLPGGGRLSWEGPAASASYLRLTAQWLECFGCLSSLDPHQWEIPGGCLRGSEVRIPGDWSGAAAFLAAGAATGRQVEVGDLDPEDEQRDRDLLGFLERAGCTVTAGRGRVRVAGPLCRGFEEDLEACPDLGPVMAALAALAPEPSVLTGLQTLPHKECDRLEASADLVAWLGGRAQVVGGHTLRVQPGKPPPERAPYDPRHDHRMAFAAAVGGLRHGGELLDPHCVGKTLPNFWELWAGMLRGAP